MRTSSNKKMKTLIFLVGVLGFVDSASGYMVYSSQNRFVELWGRHPYIDEQVVMADNYGVFNEDLGVSRYFAEQYSILLINGFIAEGRALGTYGPPAGSSYIGGRSMFSVDFELNETVSYQLIVSMETPKGVGNYVNVLFSGPNRVIIEEYRGDRDIPNVPGFPFFNFDPLVIEQSGVLEPGEYHFEIKITGGESISVYDVTFEVVPEPNTLLLSIMATLGMLIRYRKV